MLKAVLSDLDGTLVDSAHANGTAYAQALAQWGIIVDPDWLSSEIGGRSWRDFLPELLATHGGGRPALHADATPEAIARSKQAIFPNCLHLMRLNERLLDLLNLLRGQLALGLVTTASSASVEVVLNHFRLTKLFDVVVNGNHVARAKPFPDAYVLAARQLDVTAEECLVIEDSEVGLAAAQAFGAGSFRWCPR